MKAPDRSAAETLATAMEIGDPAARRVYLDGACAGDAALRQEVESLLAAHEQARGFMNTAAMPGSPHALPTEQAGDRIGHYKLLAQIGEGGFGVVWMAEQEEPVRRWVALKIIKLGRGPKEVVARFEAERQALAMMDHPNIAKVFDGGAIGAPSNPRILLQSHEKEPSPRIGFQHCGYLCIKDGWDVDAPATPAGKPVGGTGR